MHCMEPTDILCKVANQAGENILSFWQRFKDILFTRDSVCKNTTVPINLSSKNECFVTGCFQNKLIYFRSIETGL